jgi:uncharacterized repeat protein (TIGR03803 family)
MKSKSKRWLQLACAGLSLLAGTAMVARAETIYNFGTTVIEGSDPRGSLTRDGAYFYGVTIAGGVYSCGTIFRMYTNGWLQIMHDFYQNSTDGAYPVGTLAQSGNMLYGMTYNGGGPTQNGTIFKITTNGYNYEVIHRFIGGSDDGRLPCGSVTSWGNILYGMTKYGGIGDNGVIFAIYTDGTGYTNLYHFTVSGGGANPLGDVLIEYAYPLGIPWPIALYGMTSAGGTSGLGVIFKYNLDGSGYTVLHNFTGGGSDGANPQGSLTMVGDRLFGMTLNGGANNQGVVFSMKKDGSDLQLLAGFGGNPQSPMFPEGSLTAVGSTLYGFTSGGGVYTRGTVFSVKTNAADWTTILSIGSAEGHPVGQPVVMGNSLYGMFATGGTVSPATGGVFRVTMPIRPKLFYQSPSGQIASWQLDSVGAFLQSDIIASTGGWALKAAGDVDGDGVADLLFQNAANDTGGWFMNPDGTYRDARFWWPTGNWEIKACADYLGAGRAQVFFQRTDGTVAYWQLDPTGVFQSATVLGNQGAWKLKAATDLDGNGYADLIWQNASGTIAIWYHQADGSNNGLVIGSTSSWEVRGTVDIDANGAGDFIFQTPDSRTGGWFMNVGTAGTYSSASFWWATGGWQLKAAGR